MQPLHLQAPLTGQLCSLPLAQTPHPHSPNPSTLSHHTSPVQFATVLSRRQPGKWQCYLVFAGARSRDPRPSPSSLLPEPLSVALASCGALWGPWGSTLDLTLDFAESSQRVFIAWRTDRPHTETGDWESVTGSDQHGGRLEGASCLLSLGRGNKVKRDFWPQQLSVKDLPSVEQNSDKLPLLCKSGLHLKAFTQTGLLIKSLISSGMFGPCPHTPTPTH